MVATTNTIVSKVQDTLDALRHLDVGLAILCGCAR